LLKKATDFAMGGWWLGGTHNIPNPQFVDMVRGEEHVANQIR
jgi:hypothetical protein